MKSTMIFCATFVLLLGSSSAVQGQWSGLPRLMDRMEFKAWQGSPGPIQSDPKPVQYRIVRFRNAYTFPIKTALHYQTNAGWRTSDWILVQPGETKTIARTVNRFVCTYAESTNHPVIYWKGDFRFYHINNSPKKYGFRKWVGRDDSDYVDVLFRGPPPPRPTTVPMRSLGKPASTLIP